MSRWLFLLMTVLLCTGTISSLSSAQDTSPAAKSKGEKSAGKTKPIAAEREAELLDFVQTHHPELAELLAQLKPAQAKEYQAAIGDLDRDVRRLEQLRKRGPKQYDTELAMWVSRSRIRLMSARLSMSDDEELREQLRAELRQLRELELASLQQEIGPLQQSIEKQQQKLKKLQQRLSDLQSNDEEWLAKQLTELEPNPKPAAKPKNKSTTKPKAKPESRPELEQKPE